MNNGRLLRAIITGLTLLAVLWFLHLLGARRPVQPTLSQARRVEKAVFVPQKPRSQEAEKPKVERPEAHGEIGELPFAVMENSCLDGEVMDLSDCTGLLSGGRGREYTLHVKPGENLRITVEPLYEEFDVSFALLNGDFCIVGRDKGRKGESEQATVHNLAAGDYRLCVGGYDGDCGPYLLTVEDQPPSLAQIRDASAYNGRNGTVLRWKSFGEVDLTEYQIYRLTNDNRERIAVLRPHGSPAGFSVYRFMDRGHLPGSAYEVEMVARDGRSERVEIAS